LPHWTRPRAMIAKTITLTVVENLLICCLLLLSKTTFIRSALGPA
jgi:hypothetical protein